MKADHIVCDFTRFLSGFRTLSDIVFFETIKIIYKGTFGYGAYTSDGPFITVNVTDPSKYHHVAVTLNGTHKALFWDGINIDITSAANDNSYNINPASTPYG